MPPVADMIETANSLPPVLTSGLATSTIDGGALGAIVAGAIGWAYGGSDKAQEWFALGGIVGGGIDALMYVSDLAARLH